MPEFSSVKKASQRDYVKLTNPNPTMNISWDDAEKLASYLNTLGVKLVNIFAVSLEGHKYEKKWVMENGWSSSEPLNIVGETVVTFNDMLTTTTTSVDDQQLATLASNISTNPKWAFERLLDAHGISGMQQSHYYIQFPTVQDAVSKLF